MNQGEIAERLIRAAEIEQVGSRVGPPPLRAQQLAYVHSEADMRNWGHRRGERRSKHPAADACRLRPEDADAHALYRREFFEKLNITARDVSEAEEAWGWYALVEDEGNRAALAGWVRCMANHKREHFKDWCFGAGIHPITGRRRKDRALARISAHLSRRTVQHCDNGPDTLLPETPENDDIGATLAADATKADGILSWAADDAFTSFLSDTPADFNWARKRNEQRRQREAKKRKQEEAA